MKKILAFALAFALAFTMSFALAGCGSGSDFDDEEEIVEEIEAVTEEVVEEDSDFAQFKETMDDYEDFMNSYCDLVEEYNSNPAAVMDKYLEMTTKYTEVMAELDAIGEDELTDEELEYYLEVMNRINKRLAEVAY